MVKKLAKNTCEEITEISKSNRYMDATAKIMYGMAKRS